MTPDELPADMEDLLAFVDQQNTVLLDREVPSLKASIRALLKAYQEQRRALERIEQGLPEIRAVHRFTETRLIARAALNQKGDQR
jgi:hypothetical protein